MVIEDAIAALTVLSSPREQRRSALPVLVREDTASYPQSRCVPVLAPLQQCSCFVVATPGTVLQSLKAAMGHSTCKSHETGALTLQRDIYSCISTVRVEAGSGGMRNEGDVEGHHGRMDAAVGSVAFRHGIAETMLLRLM